MIVKVMHNENQSPMEITIPKSERDEFMTYVDNFRTIMKILKEYVEGRESISEKSSQLMFNKPVHTLSDVQEHRFLLMDHYSNKFKNTIVPFKIVSIDVEENITKNKYL